MRDRGIDGPNGCPRKVVRMAAVLVLALPLGHALAGPKMRFDYVGNGGNCAQCSWIEASGEITADTPGDFAKFAKDQADRGFTMRNDFIALDSAGGNVAAAVDLGEAFRKEGVVTSVAAAVIDPADPVNAGGGHSYTMSPGHCMSACFFAFAGGRRRTLEPSSLTGVVHGSILGIHRFALAQGTQSVVSAQQLGGMLSSYLSRMGVDPAILAIAASVPDVPPGNMHAVSLEEAARFHIVNMGLPPPSWSLERTADGRALTADLKGTAESDASSYNAWDYEAILACRRSDAERITLLVQISSDHPFPPGNTFMHDVPRSFTFELRWKVGNTIYRGSAATSSDPASVIYAGLDGVTPRQVGSFDLGLAFSAVRDGKMILGFVLGPKSIALIDTVEKVWLVTDGKTHADQGWLPDEIPLPWQQRANITGLLRNNCIGPNNG